MAEKGMLALVASFACDRSSDPATGSRPTEGSPEGGILQSQPARDDAPLLVDPAAAVPNQVSRAIALLHPTSGSLATGTVSFESTFGGVIVRADLRDLAPGRHAYHIHLLGDCSGPEAKTADTYFSYGDTLSDRREGIRRFTGNLGELVAGPTGLASASQTLLNATLQGPYSIIGRSVIVHQDENDPWTPPIGGVGRRLACGVIGIDDAG